jgi:putative tryptophan/tyrosine transport system substrate-binding protein
MKRRQFIAGLGFTAAWPLVARAQRPEPVRHVGVLMNGVPGDAVGQDDLMAFRQGLMELGWIEGRNIDIEFRWPGGDIERAQTFAKELVGLRPDVLLVRTTPAADALKKETNTIPIVLVNVVAPDEQGFVQSLARPGGNITGFTNFEESVGGKMLQLLKEIDPRIKRVAMIYNPQTAPFGELYLHSMESAAPVLAVETVTMLVQSVADIEAAMTAFARQPGGGVVAIPDSFTVQYRDRIIALSARYRLPVLYTNLSATPSGGLMAYAVDTRDLMHRAASYIDRILKGAKPADLPVQQPARFQLSINLKTAKAIGLDVAPNLLARAEEVIE